MISFLISLLVTALLTPGVIAVAQRLGWVARPREDRWHSRPTALMGGAAIFAGTMSAWALSAWMKTKDISCCLLGVSPYDHEAAAILEFSRETGIPVYADLNSALMSAGPQPGISAAA